MLGIETLGAATGGVVGFILWVGLMGLGVGRAGAVLREAIDTPEVGLAAGSLPPW